MVLIGACWLEFTGVTDMYQCWYPRVNLRFSGSYLYRWVYSSWHCRSTFLIRVITTA